MKTTLKNIMLFGFVIWISSTAMAQEKKEFNHTFSPQLMTRGEYRHGYQALVDTNAKPGSFISQRTRLTYKLSSEKFDIVVAPQDIRVWGSTSNLSPDNAAKLSLAEGYGVIKLADNNQVRLGRQIIQYDEHRIFGSLDWAMQSRRHDLLLFQHTNDTLFTYHIGLAWNQDAESGISNFYTLPNHYKTFQYLWIFRKFNSADVSFLFLNQGFQFSKTLLSGGTDISTVFNQTFGFNANYKLNKFKFLGWFYYQMGTDALSKVQYSADSNKIGDPKEMQGLNASLDVNYKVSDVFNVTLGGEYLSGTSQDSTQQNKNFSFNPWYGTNHRFNGYMDYFYVGNHVNNVGLVDVYLKLNFVKNRFGTGLNLHSFMTAADVKDVSVSTASSFAAMNSTLGQEVDLTFTYKISEGVGIQAGYSQMFGTNTLRALKGGQTTTISNWAYVMVLFRPGAIWPKTGLKQ